MFTQCPQCGTVFSVSDEQLDAAGGRVRCGACRAPFDALLYLVRRLPAGPARSTPGKRPRPPAAGAGLAAPAAPLAPEPALPRVPAAPARPGDTEAVPPASARDSVSRPAPGAGTTADREPAVTVPEPLRADAERAGRGLPSAWAAAFQGAVAVVLLALLGFQVAWLAPADVLARAPGAGPWIERLAPAFDRASSLLGWERTPPPRDLGRIRVRERDIREHPDHPGALLVQATLINEAPFRQAPPRVRLTLFDVNGAVLAQRVFRPQEYLSGESADGGLWPLRLELLAPATAAVSYQIEFL
ncbi:MAG: zinc-ribbon domain-containing protein [Gammaproteobacteria bacterium]|nr:zinc-ribbon domain-containing protein [Gammaproteobacteria bacterium]